MVLGNRGIIDQGPWERLNVTFDLIAKFLQGHHSSDNAILPGNFNALSTQFRIKDETKIDLARQSGDPAIYGDFLLLLSNLSKADIVTGYYLSFFNPKDVLYLVACIMTLAFFVTIPQYWLQLWTESGSERTSFYVLGFLFLSFMSWASTSAQLW